MPSNEEVVDVIEDWSGKRPEKMSQNLEDWWNQTAPGSSHSAVKFKPDGIDDLIKKLKKKFPTSPVLSQEDFAASDSPGGKIKTIQDLVRELQPASRRFAAAKSLNMATPGRRALANQGRQSIGKKAPAAAKSKPAKSVGKKRKGSRGKTKRSRKGRSK
jgi:hypothetical protein